MANSTKARSRADAAAAVGSLSTVKSAPTADGTSTACESNRSASDPGPRQSSTEVILPDGVVAGVDGAIPIAVCLQANACGGAEVRFPERVVGLLDGAVLVVVAG